MRLDTLINTKTKHQLLQLSLKLKRTTTDEQRALIKGDYYADEIQKIRHLSKNKLVQYMNDLKMDKGVKLGRLISAKIAHSKKLKDRKGLANANFLWKQLDETVIQKLELLNYGRNRLYQTS